MVRGKHLSRLSLTTVAVKLIEENSHDIFAIPVIGIDEVGNLADIVNEIVDGFLILRNRHTDRGILLQEYIQLAILLLIIFQSLRQGTVNPVMEGAVIHVFQLLKTVLRVVTLCDKGASRENHTVLQVRHTELEMQAVVDFLRDFEDVVAIEFLARTQANIVVLVFQALGRIRQLDFVSEYADSTAAIKNTDGLGVFLGNYIDILEQFLDMLFLGNTFCFRFRLQNDGGFAGVIRQIPAIGLIVAATKS